MIQFQVLPKDFSVIFGLLTYGEGFLVAGMMNVSMLGSNVPAIEHVGSKCNIWAIGGGGGGGGGGVIWLYLIHSCQ